MPGYILHLTAAQMVLFALPETSLLYSDLKGRNAFLAGSLLPDTVKEKRASHFRNPQYSKNMIEYPDMDLFLGKYKGLLRDKSCLGYYFHLFVDRKFFKQYLPQLIDLYDDEDHKVEEMAQVKWVYLKRTGQKISRKEFFSAAYLYGDYTKMNTYLVERYNLPLTLDIEIRNPGIYEVDYKDLEGVLQELRGYLSLPSSSVKELKVFEIEHLLGFLEEISREFVDMCMQNGSFFS